MSDMTEREMDMREGSVAGIERTEQGSTAEAGQNVSKAATKEHHETPETAPELFTDPITVSVTLSEGQAEHHHVPKDFVYECICYPHTPNADFEVVLPDGCRENTWTHVDETTHDHSFLIFAISLRLDHMLIDENRHADIFPESARQDRLEEEAFEAERAEYRRTHPDAGRQPMKVTLTAPEPRI